jgi:hypothetical protein
LWQSRNPVALRIVGNFCGHFDLAPAAAMASSIACGSSLKMATFKGLSARSLGLRGGEPAGSVDMLTGESAARREGRGSSVVTASLKDLRDRIATVKNTQKITDAMKLVAAAKVRRAQEAVVNGRPFSENLVKVLFNVNEQLATEDIDIPLTNVSVLFSVL